MIYITGDCHGYFEHVEQFCDECSTTTDDVLIVLGDAGINYDLGMRDMRLKQELSEYLITFFCIHGNHEERPYNIEGYEEMDWHGGKVYIEENYPNILFADDGETYDFDGKKAIVIGGAYSVDKYYRLTNGMQWFDSEQPDEVIKAYVETMLDSVNWQIDYVFSHTCPAKYMPVDLFIPGLDQSRIDHSTEEWLDAIEERLDYGTWYFGHYHGERTSGNSVMLYNEIIELGE